MKQSRHILIGGIACLLMISTSHAGKVFSCCTPKPSTPTTSTTTSTPPHTPTSNGGLTIPRG